MKLSHRLLKELTGTKKSAKELERLLMFHAFEVEEVTKYEHGLDDVYVGLVEQKEKHPNADRLNVAIVNVGRQGTHQIVCGAPNLAVGQKVAVVLPGATLPGDFAIEAREIRGVASSGMICSEKELGISEGHEGILVLPEDTPVGALFAKHFGLDDSVLDIKVLPDRAGDALSYQGIAREIAALDGYAPEFTEIEKKQLRVPAYNRAPKITVVDKVGCPRYIGLYFENVQNTESPLWLKVRLLVSGLRPKSLVVDITNYLMLLTGNPMHAFDADKITKGITVRKAKKGEKLKILTGQTLRLDPADIVIADGTGPLALAGVMGGDKSAVTDKTKNVFLEIATFEPATIRRTRTRHKLFTDASFRFERGLDPNLPKDVSVEVVDLFQSLCGAKLLGMRDEKGALPRPRKIRLSLERVADVLGSKVPLFEVVQHLALLGLKVKNLTGKKMLEVTVPTRRRDLVDEWNLIEEIARMRGYDKVLPEAPVLPLTLSTIDPLFAVEDAMKNNLAAKGFSENYTYSFLSPKEESLLKRDYKMYALANPLSPDESILRPSIVPGLARAAVQNARTNKSVRFFETGAVFSKGKKGPEEVTVATLVDASFENMFFTAKALLETILKEQGVPTVEYRVADSVLYQVGQAADVFCGGVKIASLGIVAPALLALYDKTQGQSVVAIELFLEPLVTVRQAVPVYQPLPRFPFALRDISLAFASNVTAAEVEAVLQASGAPLLRSYELFDIFEKDDAKRLAYHLAFGHDERTLTSEEVDAAFAHIAAAMREQLGGSL